MKNWLKQNWFKVGLLAALVIFIVGAFYWYGYRPYKAKKDCAWVKMHNDAVVYKPAIGNKDDQNNCVSKCLLIPDENNNNSSNPFIRIFSPEQIKNQECTNKCSSLYSPEQSAEPEKNWWRQASKEEYQDCLRGGGF